ncbi:hypothetical protein [Actinotalea solisilvae]|uniref:hypothetical protein n=1 Tax=Actinotalea solisilvae TaxID=2072922 RepID=UPI0018F14C57|nr:hypothetical protein [Actinotalea solisilvae]
MEAFLEVVGALTPSVGVGLIFWFAMRKVIHADRNERVAQAALDRQQLAEHASEPARGSAARQVARSTLSNSPPSGGSVEDVTDD